MADERKPVDVEALRGHVEKALSHLSEAMDDCETGRAAFALPQVKEAIHLVTRIKFDVADLLAEVIERRGRDAARAELVEAADIVRRASPGDRAPWDRLNAALANVRCDATDGQGPDLGTPEANASLIAAAPDLLAAAQTMVDVEQTVFGSPEASTYSARYAAAMDAMCAAIAKATGGAA